jgi:RHS repeat-associated protein
MGRSPRRRMPKLVMSVEVLEARQMLSLSSVHGQAVAVPVSASGATPAQADDPSLDHFQFTLDLATSAMMARGLVSGMPASELKQASGLSTAGRSTATPAPAAQPRSSSPKPVEAGAVTATKASNSSASLKVAPATKTPAAPAKSPTSPVIPVTPVSPPVAPVKPQPALPSVAVGGVLDLTVPSGGLTGPGLTYTITPQPLPANMTFDRASGELVFSPAPGQQGRYGFSVLVSDGSRTSRQSLVFTVTAPALATTEISGRVVGQSGAPLAGIPVTIGTATTTTDAAGDFTLTGVPASSPGPLSAGGAVGTAEGRQDLMAPVAQLLGHDPFADADNVLPEPLILPRIRWSAASKVAPSAATHVQPQAVTAATVPGFALDLASGAVQGATTAGTLRVAELGRRASAEHMPAGANGSLMLYESTGLDMTRPVVLTLPNTSGLEPGATVSLFVLNPQTGGHDVIGQMVVSSDGETMTSTGPVVLATAPSAAPAPKRAARGGGSLDGGSEASGTRTISARREEASPSTRPARGGGSLPGGSGLTSGAAPAIVPLDSPAGTGSTTGSSSTTSFSSFTGFSTFTTKSTVTTSYTTSSPTTPGGGGGGVDTHFTGCLGVEPSTGSNSPTTNCPECEAAAAAAAAAGNSSASSGGGASGDGGASGSGAGGGPNVIRWTASEMDSDAGLVTGDYFLDHETVGYMSQGQDNTIDLQYNSAQADPNPVVQYQFTTPITGDASSIRLVTAQVSVAGVLQGAAVKFNTPTGLADGQTYNIPVQIDASALPTGVYPYTMKVVEHFGQKHHKIAIASEDKGYVDVVNSSSDALGAGWSVGGLQQISQATPGGPVLITDGQQGTEQYDPVYQNGQAYLKDLATSSTTADAQVIANDGTGSFPAGTLAAPGTLTVGSATGDFNGDGKPDLAVVGGSEMVVRLDDGSGGFGAGTTYTLPSGEVAKAVAVGNFTGHSGGVLDIAVLMASTSTGAYAVAVYTGDGTGSFSGPTVSAAGGGTSSGSGPDSMIAADFNGDGKADLAFTSDDDLLEVMLASTGGAMTAAASPTLTSGHLALGVTAVDYNGDGKPDLVVEVANTHVEEYGQPFVSLDLLTGNGSGGFASTSTCLTVGQPDIYTLGLVAGDFGGASGGLEVAVPVTDGGGGAAYIDVVPLGSDGVWGRGVLDASVPYDGFTVGGPKVGNIIAADLNGSGKPSIVMTDNSEDVYELPADPNSNHFLPLRTVAFNQASGTGSSSASGSGSGYGGSIPTSPGMLAVAAYDGDVAVPGYRATNDDTSTLMHNGDGSWTRTYPDGTVVQFNASGQEVSEADRNGNATDYAYVASGQPGAGSLKTITDPVGLVTTLAYDGSGYLSTITDPAGRVTTVTVDSGGNLTEIVDPDGATTQYGYATPADHLATSETDPDGNTATAHYNAFGQLTSETLFDGTSTTSIDPAQSNGLLAPGGTGSLSSAYQGTVTDPDGRTTTLAFDAASVPASESDATGATTSITYDSRGFPVAVTDAMGRTTTYTYDSKGNVTSITQPGPGTGSSSGSGSGSGGTSTTETIAYGDPYGIPTSIIDFDGNTTTFVLDSHGNILEQERPGGVEEEWTYNSAGQVLTDTSPNGQTTTFAYDAEGRLTTITYPGAGSPHVVYGYDAAGDVTSVTDPDGNTTTYTYDEAGRVLTSQDPAQAAAGKDTASTYDADGNLLTMTDALGQVTSYAYNARNEKVAMTDPANQGTTHQTTYGYDAAGNLTSVTDPDGHTTTYAYDQDNRLVGMTDAAGDRTAYTYDRDGEETTVTDPNGDTTTYTYDNRGELSTVTQPAGMASGGGSSSGSGYSFGAGLDSSPSVSTLTYDADGNRITMQDADGHTTTYTYNALNELIAVTDAVGDTTSYGYDADGNQTTVTDGLGHTTTYAYDARDRLVSETDPSGGGTTTYTYDSAGKMTSLTDPDGNVTTWTYDAENQVATETSPTSGVTTYTYDLVGNLVETVDPDGHEIRYGYDDDNRPTTETWVNPTGGTPLDVFTTTYDPAGNVTSISDNNSAYAYTYDDTNRLTSVDNAGTPGVPHVVLDYGYDAAGNRTSLTDSLGGAVGYVYDAQDQLVGETQSGSGVASELVSYNYDAAGNMTALTRYSDLMGSSEVAATSYAYDHANRLTGITDETSGSSLINSYTYTLDAANRLTEEVKTWTSGGSTISDTMDYSYTDNNQLTGVMHSDTSFADESLSFDANGNRDSTGYSTGTGNELASDGTYDYTYDADGNMITRTAIATGVEDVYTYDYRNRLTEVQQVSGGVTTTLAQYTYDALDRRIGVVEGGTATWTVYDGTMPILDFDGSGTLVARYLDGPSAAGVDGVLARVTASGGVAWYLTDQEGTVGDIIDNSGAVTDHIDYGSFGNVLDESDPSAGDRFKYAGMQSDAAIGLYYDNARWYDPTSGRFVSQDPSGFSAGDADLYRYVGNDPTNAIDPSGLQQGIVVSGPNGPQINSLMEQADKLSSLMHNEEDRIAALENSISTNDLMIRELVDKIGFQTTITTVFHMFMKVPSTLRQCAMKVIGVAVTTRTHMSNSEYIKQLQEENRASLKAIKQYTKDLTLNQLAYQALLGQLSSLGVNYDPYNNPYGIYVGP